MDRRPCFAVVVVALCAIFTFTQRIPAEDEILAGISLSGESPRAARRIAAADKLVAQEKWTEAAEEYERILAEAGEDLVPLSARHCLQARRLCHLRLVALPAPALRPYRVRVDVQAKKWLDQGTARRDPGPLRRLVDEHFCSRFADQALDLLGDLAFEKAEFEEAERWWRMLVLPAGPRGKGQRKKDELAFPDPQVDIARVQAKQLLARLFRGERDGLWNEWEAFRSLHGMAEGHLAGRKGNYADIVQSLLEKSDNVATGPAEEAWPTFGGDVSRNRVLPRAQGRLARLPLLDGPQWTVRLETGNKGRGTEDPAGTVGEAMTASKENRSYACYPLIVDERVFVADARFVVGYHLATGAKVLQYDLFADGEHEATNPSLASGGEPDVAYTLTAAADRLYARLGTQISSPSPPRRGGNESFLVCLNLHPTRDGGLKRWKIRPQGPNGTPAIFEGAPVVEGGRACIAVTRFTGGQAQTAIACYNGDTGVLYWQRDVCETSESKEREGQNRHHLLTLAGPNVVYCSHSGAVVAVDAVTGRRAWAVRYPSRGPKTADGEPSPRGLAPCLYSEGRVYVAPLDFDRLLCLDADTGHLLWESAPLEVIHLLGVAKGRLIITVTTSRTPIPLRSIRALDAATGNPVRTWFQPADGSDLPTLGRGLLAGSGVYWPTPCGLHVLNQEDGEPLFFSPNLRGNLAAANGCLVVAGARDLSAYLPEALLGRQRKQQAAQAEDR